MTLTYPMLEGQFNPSDHTEVNNDNVSVEELNCDILSKKLRKLFVLYLDIKLVTIRTMLLTF